MRKTKKYNAPREEKDEYEDTSYEDSLPVRVYPTPVPITIDTSDNDLFTEDVVRINQAIDMVHQLSRNVTRLSSDEICRMTLTTAKLLEFRRKLLLRPYVSDDSLASKNKIVYLD